jgi:uncharacterized membrane protein
MSESSSSGKPLPALQRPALSVWSARAIAALAGVICFLALPPWLGGVMRSVAAWDLAVLVLVCEGWFVILRSDPERARQRAVAEDPGRLVILAVSLGASVISLIAAIVVIGQDQIQLAPPEAPVWLRLALGLGAIIGAWMLLHVAFTLHYARLYYAAPDTTESLEFRGGPPDDADFAYFAFGIGMTFQVPDVNVANRQMRRVVLAHQLISFAYNTAILALVINLIAGRL